MKTEFRPYNEDIGIIQCLFIMQIFKVIENIKNEFIVSLEVKL